MLVIITFVSRPKYDIERNFSTISIFLNIISCYQLNCSEILAGLYRTTFCLVHVCQTPPTSCQLLSVPPSTMMNIYDALDGDQTNLRKC